MVCQGGNPLFSQIAGHLNKVPIKIQSLSLLIEFGTDRQPERRCLLRFHSLLSVLHMRKLRLKKASVNNPGTHTL